MGFNPLFEFNVSLSLGTLAAVDAIVASSKLDAGQKDGYWLKETRVAASFTGKTAAEGPILWGVAINMTDAAQIEAYIEDDPGDAGDVMLRGSDDIVKILGHISEEKTGGNALDGVPFVDIDWGRKGWTKRVDRALLYWAYNLDGGALTTGMILKISAQHLGKWIRD